MAEQGRSFLDDAFDFADGVVGGAEAVTGAAGKRSAPVETTAIASSRAARESIIEAELGGEPYFMLATRLGLVWCSTRQLAEEIARVIG